MPASNEHDKKEDTNSLTQKYVLIKTFILKSSSIYHIEWLHASILKTKYQQKIFLQVSYLSSFHDSKYFLVKFRCHKKCTCFHLITWPCFTSGVVSFR